MARQVIVIGAGPAGLEAARSAASAGAKVTIISTGALGGRATWDTLLPSKVWLQAAATLDGSDGAAMLAALHAAASRWAQYHALALAEVGAEVLVGRASFQSADTLAVVPTDGGEARLVRGDAIIIATGAHPWFPPGLEPDGVRLLGPHQTAAIQHIPRTVVVIGGGGPSLEYADLFNRLGAHVTWLVEDGGILPFLPREAVAVVTDQLVARGVVVAPGARAERVERRADGVRVVREDGMAVEAELGLVSIGHAPDLQPLNLSAAGLVLEPPGRLPTDDLGRTSVPGIYAVGDAAGRLMAGNIAQAQGYLAGRHAAGVTVEPFALSQAVLALYSEPPIGMVGRRPAPDEGLHTVRVPVAGSLTGALLPHAPGFLELVYTSERRVVGGVGVGPGIIEALNLVALAIAQGATLDTLAAFAPGHPTSGEVVALAARAAPPPSSGR